MYISEGNKIIVSRDESWEDEMRKYHEKGRKQAENGRLRFQKFQRRIGRVKNRLRFLLELWACKSLFEGFKEY